MPIRITIKFRDGTSEAFLDDDVYALEVGVQEGFVVVQKFKERRRLMWPVGTVSFVSDEHS